MQDFRLNGQQPADPFGSDFDAAFDAADTKERVLIPPGDYRAKILRGSLGTSKSGNRFYELVFVLDEPEQPPQTVSKKLFLTSAAIGYSKAVLQRFGLDSAQKLKEPFPPANVEWVVEIGVIVRQTEGGRSFNEIDFILIPARRPAPANPFGVTPPSGSPAPVSPAASPATPAKRS